MQITHILNSFIVVETGGKTIVCDPWVGTSFHGGLRSHPQYKRDELVEFVSSADFVYISHIHPDHFDPVFLKESGLSEKCFLIKRFDNPTLKKRLQNLGVDDFIELEPWERTPLDGTLEVVLVPQLQTSNTPAASQVNYDLDTSMIFSDGQTTFFNQVDNPLGLAHFQQIKAFITEEFGSLHVAATMCGATAEYPQCFLNVDREVRSDAIIAQSLDKLVQVLNILNPHVAFLAGGTFVIQGANAHLNRFVAQPRYLRAAKALEGKTELIDLESGRTLEIRGNQVGFKISDRIEPLPISLEQAMVEFSGEPYPHEIEALPDLSTVKQNFDMAKSAYLTDWEPLIDAFIEFRLYKGMTEKIARTGQHLLAVQLGPKDQSQAAEHHVIHMDLRAFNNCMTRRQNWNQMFCGSMCFFERTPDVHTPDVLFSLNYLVVPQAVSTAEL